MRKSCLQRNSPCPHYSHSLQRCLLGYVHPRGRLGEAVSAAKQGLLYPCPHTERGQKVIEKLKN